MLTIVASRNMHLHQMDVASAFLNGDLREEIFMNQPKGYVDSSHPDYVCHLHKNLYGLKQAPRVWHLTIDPFLKSLGFVANAADPCLYFRWDHNHLSLIGLYVDDLALASDSIKHLQEIKQKLMSRFTMHDEGELTYILGMSITRNRGERTISISNETKISEFLNQFKMADANPVCTPMEPNHQLSLADCPVEGSEDQLLMQQIPYKECVGYLIYLMRTNRPDIAFPVSVVSRFLHNPGTKHWAAVKRILRYLKGTASYELQLGGNLNTSLPLVAFTDADFAGNIDTKRSTTGYLFFLNSSLISWASKSQHSVATSSTHAESLAAFQTATEAIWLRNLLNDMKLLQNKPIITYCDNQATIQLAKHHMITPRSKHFEIKIHYLREQISNGFVKVEYIKTQSNTADLMTKALPKEKFVNFRREIRLCQGIKESDNP